MQGKRFQRISGAVFGAWLSLVYAFVAVEINRSAMPEIPLPAPAGGEVGYYLLFLAAGLVFGFIACWPERLWLGFLLGTAAGVVEFLFLPWKNPLGVAQSTSITLTDVLVLVVCLLPAVVCVRMAAESLPNQPGKSQLMRQIGWPLAATVLAVILGVFALYPPDVKDDLGTTEGLMEQAASATDAASLPAAFKGVQNWFPNATGAYTLGWSDETDRLTGPSDTGIQSARDITIIVQFENNFRFGCSFTLGHKIPTCTNFE